MTHVFYNHGLCAELIYCQRLRRSASLLTTAYHVRTWRWQFLSLFKTLLSCDSCHQFSLSNGQLH